MNGLPFKLHDFGFRGSTSVEVKIFELFYLFFNPGRIAKLSFCKKGSNGRRKNKTAPSSQICCLLRLNIFNQYFLL